MPVARPVRRETADPGRGGSPSGEPGAC